MIEAINSRAVEIESMEMVLCLCGDWQLCVSVEIGNKAVMKKI